MQENGEAGAKCIQQLEELVQEVQQSAPAGLFPSGSQPGGGGDTTAAREEQLRHISTVSYSTAAC